MHAKAECTVDKAGSAGIEGAEPCLQKLLATGGKAGAQEVVPRCHSLQAGFQGSEVGRPRELQRRGQLRAFLRILQRRLKCSRPACAEGKRHPTAVHSSLSNGTTVYCLPTPATQGDVGSAQAY